MHQSTIFKPLTANSYLAEQPSTTEEDHALNLSFLRWLLRMCVCLKVWVCGM